ncbi:MAG: hypothetical protein U1D06_13350 [Paracoccaceae bacterium]|nr:hypothetical protein [Paracoccaceae bacterium]
MKPCLLVLSMLATPVFAQQAANFDPTARGPGTAVAQLVFAQGLHAHGLAQNDALALLAAAEMAGAVDMAMVARLPETTGAATAAQPDLRPGPVSAAQMQAAAEAMAAGDDSLITLLDRAKTGNALVRAGGVSASAATLAAGQTHVWTLPLDGGTLAEIGVIGDGDGNLDAVLTDAGGQILCRESGVSDRIACDLVPAETGYFTLTVQNHGPGVETYLLLSN